MKVTDTDQLARHAVLLQLATAHDRFAEEEQLAVERGEYEYGEWVHQMGNRVLRAYRVELDDPEPKGIDA